MLRRSFIRGYGLVSALGASAELTWDALLAGKSINEHTSVSLNPDKSSRVSQLALASATEAIRRAGWDASTLADPRTALVIGSSKGPIEDWIAQIESRQPASPIFGVGGVASDVGKAFGMTGPRLTLAAACASGLHALIRADMLIRTGECDRALVVGAESSLHAVFVATFKRLGVLSKSGACRPFNQQRDGFLMSEAGAALCLEARSTDTPGELFIDAGAMASDAYHVTGIDPQGQSLRHLLRVVADGRPFDLVHAHGTATDTNDSVELAAIDDVVGAGHPSVYSHKAALGHTQGAAGMIGAVLNVLMHERNTVLPNPNTTDPLPCENARLSQEKISRPIHRSLILAAGFGGAIAAVGMSRVR